MRRSDGSAGDVDYGEIGASYTRYRQPDPVIEAQIHAALGDATTVLNVGAGAGSYEPTDRAVTAVEPSASMRAQRPAHLVQAIDAVAEDLPFADNAFDASMASVTVHQWSDLEKGLAEMRRVTRGQVVLLVCDPARMHDYWLSDYIPEVRENEARRFPEIERLVTALGGKATVEPVPIPLDCRDGFN
ncbi:MAG: class I SAM-dependent methyltransferase, partial [Pseudomonadota bacterium]